MQINYTQKAMSILFLLSCLIWQGVAQTPGGDLTPETGTQATGSTTGERRIAILAFEGIDVSEKSVLAVKQQLEASLYAIPGVKIVEREKIELILKEQAFQLSGAVDETSVIRIGRLLAADVVVYGSVNRLTDITVNVKFLEVETGAVLFVVSRVIRAEKDIPVVAAGIARGAEKKLFPQRYKSLTWRLGLSGMYLVPVGSMALVVNPGFNIQTSLDIKHFLINNLVLTVKTGYAYHKGITPATDSIQMIPLTVSCGYLFELPGNFYLLPEAGIGASLNLLTYDPDGVVIGYESPVYITTSSVAPYLDIALRAGITIKQFYADLETAFSVLPARSPLLVFGAGIRLGYTF